MHAANRDVRQRALAGQADGGLVAGQGVLELALGRLLMAAPKRLVIAGVEILGHVPSFARGASLHRCPEGPDGRRTICPVRSIQVGRSARREAGERA